MNKLTARIHSQSSMTTELIKLFRAPFFRNATNTESISRFFTM